MSVWAETQAALNKLLQCDFWGNAEVKVAEGEERQSVRKYVCCQLS